MALVEFVSDEGSGGRVKYLLIDIRFGENKVGKDDENVPMKKEEKQCAVWREKLYNTIERMVEEDKVNR